MNGLFEAIQASQSGNHGLPNGVYTEARFFKWEKSRFFARRWFGLAFAADVPSPGDLKRVDILGMSVILARDEQNNIRVYQNVCRHRGRRLMDKPCDHAKLIRCPYHAWTYNLDGSLRGAPAMTQNAGFCKGDYVLPSIRCEEWLGWVFVTLNPDANPVAQDLAGVEAHIGDYNMADYVETFYETHIWDTNWKVLAENFMESYHLPVCHAGTIGGLSKLEEMVCPPGEAAFNYHTILKDDTLRIALAHPDNTVLKGERRRMTYLLAIYPSLLITLTPGYFWYLSLHPHGVGQVRIGFGGGMSRDYVDDADAQANFRQLKTLLDEVNVEDRGCTEKVYRGLSSQAAEPGHLSHLERPNYDFAQYLNGKVNRHG